MNIEQRIGSEHRILNQKHIENIHSYSVDLLERVGVWVQSKEALDILKDAGCDVSDEKRVKIPRDFVAEALESAPEEIEVFNQKGELSITSKRDVCYYRTGSDSPTHLDLHTSERLATTKKDVADLAFFCDALPNIDFVMSFGIANDSPISNNFTRIFWFPRFMDRTRFQEMASDKEENLRSKLTQGTKNIVSSHSGQKISESIVNEIKKLVEKHIPDVE